MNTERTMKKAYREAVELINDIKIAAKRHGRRAWSVASRGYAPELRVYAKRIIMYRAITGAKRLSAEEKRALWTFDAKAVAKKTASGSGLYKRRRRAFERMFSRQPTELESWGLEYVSARKVALAPTPQPEPWKKFIPVELPPFDWSDVPQQYRHGHSTGGVYVRYSEELEAWLYDNRIWDGDGTPMRVIIADSYDSPIAAQFWNDYLTKGGVLLDPDETGEPFLVYADEWNAKRELAPDYIVSRHYR